MAPKADSGAPATTTKPVQHGVKGVYYGGHWLDIEDCDKLFCYPESCSTYQTASTNDVKVRQHDTPCPRSASRNYNPDDKNHVYDVLIVGAGCIGAAVARELSRYKLSVLWVEAADDVSQGATKGNSGIVHAGYDDKPGTNRAKFCWKGNQMFPQLDRELRFGYQLNGSLVLAFNEEERKVLDELVKRGKTNGVKNLQILDREEVLRREPFVREDVVAALYSPDAGNVIPYEYTIALAENAVDNGVELRIRREVTAIRDEDGVFNVTLKHWEPKSFLDSIEKYHRTQHFQMNMLTAISLLFLAICYFLNNFADDSVIPSLDLYYQISLTLGTACMGVLVYKFFNSNTVGPKIQPNASIETLTNDAGVPVGEGGNKVETADMFTGGSGSIQIVNGLPVKFESVKAKYVVNCAGGASDKVAAFIGDDSFKIKPRLGDYLLLNRNQGEKAKHTLFPCPHPVLGKGVLVQTTLWGNLILGPTARDTYRQEMAGMSIQEIQEYILSKCRKLVPSFDARETIHAFCGARAKSNRGDWVIEPSLNNGRFIHVAGIDSPGLAGSPAIAAEAVNLLQEAGLETPANPSFNPHRAPIITPKDGMRGLKMGPIGKNDSDGLDTKKMSSNVICKCEKVTELEVVRALRRSLPIDSSQAVRKRTRAGMGHCQGDPCNYNCEARVRAIIARENKTPIEMVGARPWPATSTLTQRWINEDEKQVLHERMMTSREY